MKLKFIIIPAVVLLVLCAAFAQTSYITPIAMNISIGNAFEIFVDMTNNRVGIGNSIPNVTLDVSGDMNVSGNFTANNRRVVPDFQRFTDTSGESTWTKPAGATFVIIEVIGGGGAGGGGGGSSAGGGGGALVRGIYYGGDGTCAAGHTDNGDGTCTATFYPDAHPETTSVDGNVVDSAFAETWANKRDNTEGNGAFDDEAGGGNSVIDIRSSTGGQGENLWWVFTHGFFLFDTSAIPDNAVIGDATFGLVVSSKIDQFSDSFSLVATTPASNTALGTADLDQWGTTKLAPDLATASITADSATYNVWTLNGPGRGNIDKTGVSKFGIVATSVVDNSEPAWVDDDKNRIVPLFADTAGTSTDPRLVVTYTTGLPPTLKISVGAGGTGGTAVSGADGNGGTTGGNSYVNSTTDFNLTAYGGGGGGGGAEDDYVGGGGGGGGTGSAGGDGDRYTFGKGGDPYIENNSISNRTGGGGGRGGFPPSAVKAEGGNAEFGGGGGASGGQSNHNAFRGGSSLFAAGGGGGGGEENHVSYSGSGGGAWGSYSPGEGGIAGTGAGGAGGDGTSRNYGAGDGGGGGNGNNGNPGGAGGAGGAPGGGGGGGGAGGTGDAGAGGAGGRGEVRIWSR